MQSVILQYEPWIRLSGFGVVFLAVALAERWAPRRQTGKATAPRWMANLGLVMVDSLMLRLLSALQPWARPWPSRRRVGACSTTCSARPPGSRAWLRWGCWISPSTCSTSCSTPHRCCGAFPSGTHSDRDFDVTTGVRFHPVEVLLSLIYKMAVVAVLGLPRSPSSCSRSPSTPPACLTTATCSCLPGRTEC